MKLRILSLLASSSFVDYLEGMALLHEGIAQRTLPQRDVDGEMMERAAAVLALERWAEHEDYIEKIEYFVAQIPQYGALLTQEDNAGQSLRGIVIFINGIAQGQHNPLGFRAEDASLSGWRLAEMAGKTLAQYYAAEGRYIDSAFFTDLGEWFGAIADAQNVFLADVGEMADWNENNASGLLQVLQMADYYFQKLLLSTLQMRAHHPIVKAEIFERYLAILHEMGAEFQAAEEPVKAAEIGKLIALVSYHSQGLSNN
jgi:hypothetical protein